MASADTALASFEIDSITLGYRALSLATADLKIRVLEAAAVREARFLLLIEGPVDTVINASGDIRRLCETFADDSLADFEIIENPHPRLLPALYSLEQTDMAESLIVMETDSVSGLLSVSQALLVRGLEAIELKGGRGAFGGGVGFFTGPAMITAPAAEDARTRLKQAVRSGRVEVIDDASPTFREFFNISGSRS